MEQRSLSERKRHAIDRLEKDRDVWVATADDKGMPHLVPLSLYWDGASVIVATLKRSISSRNVFQSGRARLAVGTTRDVVMLDVSADVQDVEATDAKISEAFNMRNHWDPREAAGEWVYFVMKPVRIQVWQNEGELDGRDVMLSGVWLSGQ